MAYEYTIVKGGTQLVLSGQQKKWQIQKVDGLYPAGAKINETDVVNVPGVKKTGVKISKRNIVFYIRVNNPCEVNRAELLKFLSPDSEITLKIKTSLKELSIDGTIETCEYDVYSRSQIMQVSIMCEYPYFKSGEERITTYYDTEGGIMFPVDIDIYETFTAENITLRDKYFIYNYGQVTTGIKIEVYVYEATDTINIYNMDDETQYFTLTGGFQAGDRIFIDTNILAKDKVVLLRNGIRTKILNRLAYGVTWFKVSSVLVLAVEGSVYMTISNQDEIVGV